MMLYVGKKQTCHVQEDVYNVLSPGKSILKAYDFDVFYWFIDIWQFSNQFSLKYWNKETWGIQLKNLLFPHHYQNTISEN